MNFFEDHTPARLLRSAFTAVFFFGWYMSLIIGCSKSITSHADILYSSTGIYVLLFSLVTCKFVHKLEIAGYGFFICGVALMLTDPFATKVGEGDQAYIGDTIAFLGAGLGAVFGLLNQQNLKLYHPFVLTTHCFCFSVIFQLLLFPFLEDNELFYSTDPNYGVFGWMSDLSTCLYVEGFVVPLTGILANIGLMNAYIYWPMEIMSIAILFEPFIAQITGIALGQDEVPGSRTLFGLLVISLGLVLASYGAKHKALEQVKNYYAAQKVIHENELSSHKQKHEF